MKKSIFAIAVFLVAFVSTSEVNAQKFPGLDKSPMDVASYPSDYKNSDKVVKIAYSRPQLKGRALETLAPKDKVWRTGANEATEITFYKDVIFGNKLIEPGTYTLFTIPGDKEWIIILSTAKNVWGSYFYKEEEDVLRVKGMVSKNSESVEAFSMMFDENMNLKMGWGNTVVTVPLK